MIAAGDTSHTANIQACIEEASAIIDNQALYHNLTIATGSMTIIPYICADLAAGLYSKKFMPQTDEGFYAIGMKHLEEFFKGYLGRPLFYFVQSSGSGYNLITGSGVGSGP